MVRRQKLLLVGTLSLLGVFAAGNYLLDFQRWTIHWWADSFWTLASLAAGAKCLQTAYRLPSGRLRRAWASFGAGCLCWFAGMLAWDYFELVRYQITPFPAISDLGFLALAPWITLGLYYYGAPPPVSKIDIKQLCNLGIILCAIVIITVLAFFQPIKAFADTPLYLATALAYPLLYMLALFYGIICLSRYSFEPNVRIALLLLAGVALHAITETLYAASLLLKTYEAGSYLDLFWLAGFACWYCAADEQDQHGRHAPAEDRNTIAYARLKTVETALPAGALLSVVIVAFLVRGTLDMTIWNWLFPVALCLALLIGVREWWNERLESRLYAQVRQLNQFLESIIEHLPVGLFIKDAASLAYVRWNKAAADMLGRERDVIIGLTDYDLFPPEQAGSFIANDRAALAGGRLVDIAQEAIQTAQGATRIVHSRKVPLLDDQRRPSYLLGIAEDITERKRAEAALQESEQRFRGLIDATFDGIALHEDGVITDANQGFAEMFGYTLPEMLGRSVLDFVAPESHAQIQHCLCSVDKQQYEATGLRKDGSTFPAEIIAKAHTLRGRTLRMTALRDMTERRQLAAQLLQAQKMESVGRLAGGIAHDFNNLLTAIRGYTELALETLSPGDPIHDDLTGIRAATDRATALIRQLLTFARKQPAELQVLDLNACLRNIEDLLRRLIGEHITLVMDLWEDELRIHADRTQIEQVLINLSVNARDAMPDQGVLTITTRRILLDEERARAYGQPPPGPAILLTVGDTGVGMPATVQSHVFEPFFTTKGPGKGTGLGLATCYGIVQQHGGTIRLDSAEGCGTTVTVVLPFAQAPAPAAGPAPAPALSLAGAGTILLVEDEQAVRALVARVLGAHGYTVVEAANGVEALSLARAYPETIDLLLTDMVMPELGGAALAAELVIARPGMAVLFMSGYTDTPATQLVPQGAAIPLLHKPFTPLVLLQTVRAVLAARTQRGAPAL